MKVLFFLLLPFASLSQSYMHGTLIVAYQTDSNIVVGEDSKVEHTQFITNAAGDSIRKDSVYYREKTYKTKHGYFSMSGLDIGNNIFIIDSCIRNSIDLRAAARMLVKVMPDTLKMQYEDIRKLHREYFMKMFDHIGLALLLFGIENGEPTLLQVIFKISSKAEESIAIFPGWFPVYNDLAAIGTYNDLDFSVCKINIKNTNQSAHKCIRDFIRTTSGKFDAVGGDIKVVTIKKDGTYEINQ